MLFNFRKKFVFFIYFFTISRSGSSFMPEVDTNSEIVYHSLKEFNDSMKKIIDKKLSYFVPYGKAFIFKFTGQEWIDQYVETFEKIDFPDPDKTVERNNLLKSISYLKIKDGCAICNDVENTLDQNDIGFFIIDVNGRTTPPFSSFEPGIIEKKIVYGTHESVNVGNNLVFCLLDRSNPEEPQIIESNDYFYFISEAKIPKEHGIEFTINSFHKPELSDYSIYQYNILNWPYEYSELKNFNTIGEFKQKESSKFLKTKAYEILMNGDVKVIDEFKAKFDEYEGDEVEQYNIISNYFPGIKFESSCSINLLEGDTLEFVVFNDIGEFEEFVLLDVDNNSYGIPMNYGIYFYKILESKFSIVHVPEAEEEKEKDHVIFRKISKNSHVEKVFNGNKLNNKVTIFKKKLSPNPFQ